MRSDPESRSEARSERSERSRGWDGSAGPGPNTSQLGNSPENPFSWPDKSWNRMDMIHRMRAAAVQDGAILCILPITV